MLKSVWGYASEEVRPRLRQIFTGGELYVALLAGAGVWVFARALPLSALEVGSVVGMLLTYAAIALGFCVAGMTIALTLPNGGFAQTLARKTLDGRTTNAYSDLLFVFSWTAIAHWALIVALIAVQVASQSGDVVLKCEAGNVRRAVVSVIAFGTCYTLCQFLITLITLSEVGQVYCTVLRADQEKE